MIFKIFFHFFTKINKLFFILGLLIRFVVDFEKALGIMLTYKSLGIFLLMFCCFTL